MTTLLMISLFFLFFQFSSAADFTATLTSADGSSSFTFKDSNNSSIAIIDSDGNALFKGGLRLDSSGIKCETTEMLIVDGKIGIGTANPDRPLHIASDNSQPLKITGTAPTIFLSDTDVTDQQWQIRNQDGLLSIQTQDNEGSSASSKFWFTQSGLMGIGKNPGVELDVSGRIKGVHSSYGVYGEDSDTGVGCFLGYGSFGLYSIAPDTPSTTIYSGYCTVGSAAPYPARCYLAYKTSTDVTRGIYARAAGTSGSIAGFFVLHDNTAAENNRAVSYVGYVSGANYYGGYFQADYAGTGYGCYGRGNSYDFYAGGSGSNYGPFTGGHDVILHSSVSDCLMTGMIMSTTGYIIRKKNSISYNLNEVRLSDKESDPMVFGVFVKRIDSISMDGLDLPAGLNFGIVNAVGEGSVWICNQLGELNAGDYITTSTVPGYGAKQDTTQLHSYTLGKLTEKINWSAVKEYVSEKGSRFFFTDGRLYTTDNVEYNPEKHGKIYKCHLAACTYHSG